jgi:hypothetical protein
MAHKVKRILDRFTELKAAIPQAALRDTQFRSLCEDYDAVADVIAFWSQSTDIRGAMLVREYGMLLDELEAEIFRQLRRPH